MSERVLVTIHAAIPVDAFPTIERLCRKLRKLGDGDVMFRQVAGDLRMGTPPVFELFVTSGTEQ